MRARPPELQIPEEPWVDDALCAQVDPEMFWPAKGATGHALTQAAKKVCAMCDVREECLIYALRNDEQDGIWGGLSPRQRRALKRRLEEARVERMRSVTA